MRQPQLPTSCEFKVEKRGCTNCISEGTRSHTNIRQVWRASSELQRNNSARNQLRVLQADFDMASGHQSASALHFCGKEDALSFTVRGRDRLQLQEIQQHLDLRGNATRCRDNFDEWMRNESTSQSSPEPWLPGTSCPPCWWAGWG